MRTLSVQMSRQTGDGHVRPRNGFTLIEIAVGLLILSLLFAALLSLIPVQIEQRRIAETQNGLTQISEALMGFAMSKGYLPCPDKTSDTPAGGAKNDGTEDVKADGTCIVPEGNLPWVTLGIPSSDAWGRVFHYRVTAAFANRSPSPLFKLDSAGTLTICSTAAVSSTCPPTAPTIPPIPATTYSTSAPAVILSYGKNGYGGIVNIAYTTLPAPTSADEIENTNGNAFFVSRTLTAVGAPVGEFDDLVSWISTPVLMSRMVSAQKLP